MLMFGIAIPGRERLIDRLGIGILNPGGNKGKDGNEIFGIAIPGRERLIDRLGIGILKQHFILSYESIIGPAITPPCGSTTPAKIDAPAI